MDFGAVAWSAIGSYVKNIQSTSSGKSAPSFPVNKLARHVCCHDQPPVISCQGGNQMTYHVLAVESIMAINTTTPREAIRFELITCAINLFSLHAWGILRSNDFLANLNVTGRKNCEKYLIVIARMLSSIAWLWGNMTYVTIKLCCDESLWASNAAKLQQIYDVTGKRCILI